MVVCPDDNRLLDFVDGRLAPEAGADVAAHAVTCAGCRDIIAHVRAELRPLRLAPADLDRYTLLGEVAQGGIGRILRAHDRHLGREVALKVPRDPRDCARFEREARITARLQHPAIVPLYEAGVAEDGTPFLTMKLVAGRSLREVIAGCAAFRDRLALLPNVLAILEALAYAHGRGVIHRDLKPANVLIGALGETVVIDWGLAKVIDGEDDAPPPGADVARCDETLSGTVLGTPAYMSPEQARGEPVDARSDVYALGALLYHVLSGAPPYSGASPRSVLADIERRPPPPIEVREPATPPDLAAIVRKAMARAPAERYATAKELADDVRRHLTGQLVSSHDYSLALLIRRWLGRHRPAVASAALLLIGLLVAAWASVRRVDAARRDAEARRDALVLAQARTFVAKDPTTALAWLQLYPRGGGDWARARDLVAEVESAGVARGLFRRVHDVAPAPAGGWMAIAGDDGIVRLWNAASGAVRALPAPDEPVHLVSFTPDGRTVAALGARSLWSWDVATGARRLRWRAAADLPWRAEFLTFAPDGGALAAVVGPDVLVWRAPGDEPRRLVGDAGPIEGLEFTPDGRALATVSLQGAIRLWQLDSGASRLLGRHEGVGNWLSVSPDGRRVASSGSDDVVRVWRTDGGAARVLAGHTARVYGLGFLPDGRLVSAGYDQTVRIWPPDDGPAVVLHAGVPTSPAGGLRALAVAADGRHIAAAGHDALIYVWDLAGGGSEILRGAPGSCERLTISDDGRWLVSLSADDTWRVWDLARRLPAALAGAADAVAAAAFAPDGRWLAIAAGPTLRLCASGSGACRELAGHRGPITALAFAPDARWLASGAADGEVFLWSMADGAGRPLGAHAGRVLALRWSPEGRSFASASDDRTVREWDVRDGTPRVVARQADALEYVAFSPDGRWLAAGAADRTTIELTDLTTGAGTALRGHTQWVRAVAFSADSRLLASTAILDPSVRIWDLPSGRSRTFPQLGSLWASWLRFSPDGLLLASCGQDGTVKLWDTRSGALRELEGHVSQVRAAAFSPDGRTLITGGDDGSLRVWDVPTGAGRALHAHTAALTVLAFAPGGERFVSGDRDGRAIVWNLADVAALGGDPEALHARMTRLTTAVLGRDDRAVTPLDSR
jgi:eukaryotic-like serine/threonine-protein kinase